MASAAGAIAAGSTALTLAAPSDFAVGQGIRIKGAGAAFDVAQAQGLRVVPGGRTGTTRYAYRIAMMGCDGGLGLPASASSDEGRPDLSAAEPIVIELEPGAGQCGYAVWRSVAGGDFVYAGVGDGARFIDTGWSPPWRPENVDARPPTSIRHRDLLTTVAAVSGAAVTLEAPATHGVSGAAVLHDDTQAFSKAIAVASRDARGGRADPGGDIRVPCGQYNLSRPIVVSAGGVGITGSGTCTRLQPHGGFDDVSFVGPSAKQFMFGNWLTDLYVAAYNKHHGLSLQARFVQTLAVSRVFVDHPWAGQSFHDVNDVRLSAIRLNKVWGQEAASLSITSGRAPEEYACCFDIRDWYANNLATDPALNGGRLGAGGIVIDGNVATIIASNLAISNVEGVGLRIGNAVGHPTGRPSFIQFKDFSSEFSNLEAVEISDGQEIFFTDSILHAARNGRSNLVVGERVRIVNWTGGRIGNAGCHNAVLGGTNIRVQGAAVINASAPNAGGRSETCHGIVLGASARDVAITGNVVGRIYDVNWRAARPVFVASGADRVAIAGNVFDGNVVDAVDMAETGYTPGRIERDNVGTYVPAIKSGFGRAASVAGANGPYAFRVKVGAGGTASQGVVALPPAALGWSCDARSLAPVASDDAALSRTRVLNRSEVELSAYSATGTRRPWPPDDTLAVTCTPM